MRSAERIEVLQSDGEEAHGGYEAMPLIQAWKNGFCLQTIQNLVALIGIESINMDPATFES
jgi:hypothetical protein